MTLTRKSFLRLPRRKNGICCYISTDLPGLDFLEIVRIDGNFNGRDIASLLLDQQRIRRLAGTLLDCMWYIPREGNVGGAVFGCHGQSPPHGASRQITSERSRRTKPVDGPCLVKQAISERVVPTWTVTSITWERRIILCAVVFWRLWRIVAAGTTTTVTASISAITIRWGRLTWLTQRLTSIEAVAPEELRRLRDVDADIVGVGIEAVDRSGL